MASGSAEKRVASPVPERFGDDAATVAGFITAEHAALETARSATIFEANGRVSSYLATLSGSVVALAFIGEASAMGRPFYVFLFLLLPVNLFLGVVTFERALQSSMADGLLARRVNRLRRFYTEYHPAVTEYLEPPADDTPEAVMNQGGITLSRWQAFLTAAGTVGVLNSVVVGLMIGLVVDLLISSLVVGVLAGIVGAVIGGTLHLWRLNAKWG